MAIRVNLDKSGKAGGGRTTRLTLRTEREENHHSQQDERTHIHMAIRVNLVESGKDGPEFMKIQDQYVMTRT